MGGDITAYSYGSSKAALNWFVQAIAATYGKQGIRSNAILPGPTQTPANLQWSTPEMDRLFLEVLNTPFIGEPGEIERQMAFATNNKGNEVNILSNDRMVMQERSDTAIIMGRPCPHQMVAIYEFDEAGLIPRWREYLDMADLTRKMGIDEAAAGGTEVPA